MKKYIVSLFFVLFAVLLVSLSFAATEVVNSGGNGENLTLTDLGVENPGILPISPFYFLKEWRRGFTRLFTFNSIKKVELELQIVNEKAAETLKIKEDNPQDVKALKKALDNYNLAEDRLKNKFELLKETSQNPNIDKLIENIVSRGVKHQQLFDELLKEHTGQSEYEDLVDRVDHNKDNIEDLFITAAEKDDSEKFADKFEKAVLDLKGNELKNIRSLEIVEHFKNKTSEDLKKSLEKIRFNFSEKLKNDIKEIGADDLNVSADDIKERIENLAGDQSRHLIILNEIEQEVEKKNADVFEKAGDDLEDMIKEDKNIDKKAEEQITNAETAISELQSEFEKFAINEPGVSNNNGEERQTPKRDFGDKIKSKLNNVESIIEKANEHVVEARADFADTKFGEAFGKAISAEILARKGLKIIMIDIESEANISEKDEVKKDEKSSEKRVFPETNNRTVCDDAQATPACSRGDILECHNGKWVCVSSATGTGKEDKTSDSKTESKSNDSSIETKEGDSSLLPDYTVDISQSAFGVLSANSASTGLQAGDDTTFAAMINDLGAPTNASSNVRLRLDIDNNGSWDLTKEDTIEKMDFAPPLFSTVWFGGKSGVWTAKTGTHKYEICADTENIIIESNENNNCASQTFTVK